MDPKFVWLPLKKPELYKQHLQSVVVPYESSDNQDDQDSLYWAGPLTILPVIVSALHLL